MGISEKKRRIGVLDAVRGGGVPTQQRRHEK
jgi:hypothetical protein